MVMLLRSLVWEFGRRLTPPLAIALMGLLLVPWLLGRIVLGLPGDEFDSRIFYVAYFCGGGFLFSLSASTAQVGVRQRLFLLPLSTQFIAAWLIIAPMFAVMLGHVVSTAVINQVYGASWPWWRPLLYLALLSILGNVAYWRLLSGSALQIPSIVVVVAAVLFSMYGRFTSDGFLGDLRLDVPLSSGEVCVVLVAGVILSWVGYRTLGDLRLSAADHFTPAMFVDRLDTRLRRTQTANSSTWSTPADAIRSQAWRDGAVQGVLGATLVSVLTGLLIAVAFANGAELLQLTTALLIVIPASQGMLLGITVGMSLRRPGKPDQLAISSFLGTKPVTTPLIWAQLEHVLYVGSAIGWLASCLVCGLVGVLCFSSAPDRVWAEYPHWDLVSRWGVGAIPFWLALSFSGSWAVARLSAAIACFGRDQLIRSVVIGAAIPALAFVLSIPMLPWEARANVVSMGLLALGLMVAAATIFSFSYAHAKSLLGPKQLVTGAVIWIAAAGLLFCLTDWSLARQLASVGSSGAVVASIAVGPLALWTNRHR